MASNLGTITEIYYKVKNDDGTITWKSCPLAVTDVLYNGSSCVSVKTGVASINVEEDTFDGGTTTVTAVGSLAAGTDIGGMTPKAVLKLILGIS